MTEELKPCPFKHNINRGLEIWEDRFGFVVKCWDCKTDGPLKLQEQEAIKAWNIRAEVKDER